MSQGTRGKREGEGRAAVAAPGLLTDDSGAVLMWTLFIALPVFFALGALVVDAHRTYNTFDEAQNFADHTALAAARELNGRAGAITRAIQAACGPGPGPLVAGTHTYGRAGLGGARPLAAGQLTFLSALGPDPSAPNQYAPAVGDIPICTATCGAPAPCLGLSATLNASARFVEVTTEPVTVDWLLWPVMRAFGVATLNSADAAARATAGQIAGVCNVAPLFMCNPLQLSGGNLNDPQYVGMQMKVKSGGGGNKWVPGDFGLLQAFNSTGANAYAEAVAKLNPTNQCTGYVVKFDQGQKTEKVADGFNVRFDMIDDKDWLNNADYPAAKNVTKGLVTSIKAGSNKCDYNPSADTMPIPQDSCFSGGACRFSGNAFGARWGTGDWNCAGYWTTNHGTAVPPGVCGSGFTRWDLYKYEIANGIPNKSGSENGNPTCSNQSWTPPPGQLDRREFVVAVIDCLDAGGASLYQGNSQKEGVPVREYVRVFLTEPVAGASEKTVFMEYLGPANPAALKTVFREYPVLYR